MGETAVPLTGMRAVILQICHPAVAAAGAGNSVLKQSFIPRARSTFATMYRLMFADMATVDAAGERVRAMHDRVTGIIPPQAGGKHVGQPYRADEPELLAWVLATLIDSTFVAYDRLLQPMDLALAEDFYQQMLTIGGVLGMPRDALPADVVGFHRYFDRMLASDELVAGEIARDLVGFLMTDGWDLGPLDETWASGILPARFIEDFGLPTGRRARAGYQALLWAARTGLRATPAPLRKVPPWHAAMVRIARAEGRRPSRLSRVLARAEPVLAGSSAPVGPSSG